MSSEPTTAAGRALHRNDHGSVCSFADAGNCALVNDGPWGKALIPAIEAEAVAAYRVDLEAKVRTVFDKERRAKVRAPENGGDSEDAFVGYALNDAESAVLRLLTDGAEPRKERAMTTETLTKRDPWYPGGERDASKWVEEFFKTYPNGCADADTMLGWFANAIETGVVIASREPTPEAEE